jgi:hypothetical protein
MNQSIAELAGIRETVSKLLDELQLEAYLFEIEPQEGQWQLTVECAIDEGWETVKLKANKNYFQHGADDAVFHQLLLDEWRETLSACKVKAS